MHNPLAFFISAMLVADALVIPRASGEEPQQNHPFRPVAAHQLKVNDRFWWPRLEINRTATIPGSFQKCDETGRIENFRVAAGTSDAKWVGRFGFNDSDVYKVMEGAAYSLMTHPDEKLQSYLSELVEVIAAAQEDDGYLYTYYTARDRIANPKELICCYPRGDKKWLSLKDSHELYNLGHMYEAAVAHWEATGDESFLNVARKSADLLVETFAPGKIEMPSGHPEVELALVKLYRATRDKQYLDLAKFLLNVRGHPSDERPELWGEYTQDHKPLVEQVEPVGHAVRAMYLYAAATDVAALTGDKALRAAVDHLWENCIANKTYVTGGIGATGEGEAFGKPYDLPNTTAYSETCANLATCFWNHRMFLLHGDGKYIDVLERALYNSAISGVALDGKTFFYPNPLASAGNYARSKWFDCACCPTNICRFIPSIPGSVYATRGDTLYVNLFIGSEADIDVGDGRVHVEQETNYPWDGEVRFRITPQAAGQRFALKVRIPGWAQNKAFPSDLYTYLDQEDDQKPSLKLEGSPTSAPVGTDGYATIAERDWQPGDTVTLTLPMPVRRVIANEEVKADRGRVAIVRGPIVYCIEWPDVPGREVNNLVLPDDKNLATSFRDDLLGGVQVVTGVARRIRKVEEERADGSKKQISIAQELEFTAIPYYAWAHRGPGQMAVWLPRTPDALDNAR
jgi:DUF1680 family protein